MKICHIVGAAQETAVCQPAKEDLVIAADGGFTALKKAGIKPDLLVGDLDSLGYSPEDVETIRHPVMKDDTDMMLAVRIGLSKGYRFFCLYGGLGGRMDHTIANIQTLAFIARHNGSGCLVGSKERLTVLMDGELRFSRQSRGILSVFALGGEAEGVTLRGVLYPLNNVALSPDFPLGVSNEFIGEEAQIRVKKGMLLIVWTQEAHLLAESAVDDFASK